MKKSKLFYLGLAVLLALLITATAIYAEPMVPITGKSGNENALRGGNGSGYGYGQKSRSRSRDRRGGRGGRRGGSLQEARWEFRSLNWEDNATSAY